jgi:hypothetical protein
MILEAMFVKGSIVLVKTMGPKLLWTGKMLLSKYGIVGGAKVAAGGAIAVGATALLLESVTELRDCLRKKDALGAVAAAGGLLTRLKGIDGAEWFAPTLRKFIQERGANLGTWNKVVQGAQELANAYRTR